MKTREALHAAFLAVYLLLVVFLIAGMRCFGYWFPGQVSVIDLLLLSLATFRMTELVGEAKITQFLRAPFTICTKKGEEPEGRGLRRVIGELLLCPWCSGVWIATALTFFHALAPDVAHLFLLAMAAAAGGIMLQILAKLLDRVRSSCPECDD